MIAASILLLIAIIITIPIVAVLLTRDPLGKGKFFFLSLFSFITNFILVEMVTNQSTIVTSITWNFDGTLNDVNNTYIGFAQTTAELTNISYFGYGYSLQLNTSFNSPISISTPFFNLSYTSFTVETWIYLATTVGDNAIFSQCECITCQDRCLSLIIRNGRLYMSFILDDLIGTTTLSTNTWYHVAYVYEYSSGTQSIYLRGILDGTKTSSGPYQGQSGSMIIGASNLSSNLYNGYIDELSIITMAKSATDILNDATLVAYFSFDGSSLTEDMGPNIISGFTQNTAVIGGKVGYGLSFSRSSSYLQAYGFLQLATANRSFSFSIWVYPYSVSGGNILQKSRTSANSLGCSQFIGLSSIGQIVFSLQIGAATSAIVKIGGPFMPINQ